MNELGINSDMIKLNQNLILNTIKNNLENNQNQKHAFNTQSLQDNIRSLINTQNHIFSSCSNLNVKMLEAIKFLESNLKNIKKIKNTEELDQLINEVKLEISKENLNFIEANGNSNNNYPLNNMVNFQTETGMNQNQLPVVNRNHLLNSLFMNQKFCNPNNTNIFSQNSMHMQNSGVNINNLPFSNYCHAQPLTSYNTRNNFPNQNHNTNKEYFIKEINDDSNNSLKKAAKEKFYALKEKNTKRFFQVVYMFKNKIKRMYRIDCMTRKINVNFYHYIKENYKRLNINDELLEFFKNNIRYTSRTKFQEIDKKYPNFKKIYDDYLKSDKFKKLILNIKNKYDEEYLKLFFRHSKNFLNFYLREPTKEEEAKESMMIEMNEMDGLEGDQQFSDIENDEEDFKSENSESQRVNTNEEMIENFEENSLTGIGK